MRASILPLLALLILFLAGPEIARSEDGERVESVEARPIRITSVGSDAMDRLMRRWTAAFTEEVPQVEFDIVSEGSSLAPVALLEGRAQVGPMFRPMRAPEKEEFRARLGREPVQIRVAASVLAAYVSADNPINTITIDQLETLLTTEVGEVTPDPIWKDLRVTGSLANEKIMLLAPADPSLAFQHFRQQILQQREMRKGVMPVVDFAPLFETAKNNKNALALGSYVEPPQGVKIVRVVGKNGPVSPTRETIANGEYPLSRHLSIYLLPGNGSPVSQATQRFVRFLLTKEAQAIAADEGLTPLADEFMKAEREKIL